LFLLQNSVNYDTRERISRIFKYDLDSTTMKNKKQNPIQNKNVNFKLNQVFVKENNY
jgi:hypothetical protein